MLLNLIVFKFVPGILKCLDVWRMSFSCFFLFSIVNLYSSIYKKKEQLFQLFGESSFFESRPCKCKCLQMFSSKKITVINE